MRASRLETDLDGSLKRDDAASDAPDRPGNVTRLDGSRTSLAPATATEARLQRDASRDDGGAVTPPRHRRGWFGWLVVQSARTVLPLLVIAGAIAGYQYLKATRPVPPKSVAREARVAVTAAPVQFTDVQPKLEVFGSTVAGREVDIRALVAGRVIDTSQELRDGAVIDRGDMIIKIDTFDYESALTESQAQRAEAVARRDELQASLAVERENLEFAKAQLKIAQDDLQRARQLSRRGNISDRALDERQLTVTQRRQAVAQSQNTINVWQARVRQQEAAIKRLDNTIARNRQRLAETSLKAPFDAYVTNVGAQVGRMLSVNDRVATLIDRDWIEVRFTLTDRQFGRLAASKGRLIGQKVVVNWRVGGEVISYRATIDRIAAQVSADTGGVDVFARVVEPATSGRVPLRPGAFVEITLDDVLYENVAAVPAASVYGGETVYAIVDDRLEARTVEVVGSDGGRLLVRGDLKSGERIAATRLSAPGTGVAVDVRSLKPASGDGARAADADTEAGQQP